MSINKHQPERFDTYNLLPDGKSFTIKDCKFIFKLDRYGGWRDQFGNYYNSNAEPDFEPEDGDLTPEECSSEEGYHDDDYDELYGGNMPDDDDESHEEEDTKTLQKISKNMEILSTYPNGKNLRVFFTNMPFKVPPKEVFEIFSKKVKGILNIICTLKNNKRNGEGHFILEDSTVAEKLIKLEGEKVSEREVYFEVERLEELIMDPIKQSEKKPFWSASKIPKFYNSSMKQEQPTPEIIAVSQKKEQEKKKVEKVAEEKKEKSKPQEKIPEFMNYILNFEIFATKTRFVQWMKLQKAERDVDYKNIDKKQIGGKTIITMDVRTALVASCKGKKYEGKEVIFTPNSN